jgi:hypothetical protein
LESVKPRSPKDFTMNTTTELQPRNIADGRFTGRKYGFPEVGLTYGTLPEYDPTFFYDRAVHSATVKAVALNRLPRVLQAAVRNADQAVNDAWALENGVDADRESTWTSTSVYRDGDLVIADIQHKDQSEAPFGSLIVLNDDGKLVGQYDNVSDEFGERWVPASGLRAQLLSDLAESSADGSLGDHL